MKFCNLHTRQTFYGDTANYLDKGKAVLLVLLDLSASFDTIHHDHLIENSHSSFGINGVARAWFKSYI